MDVIIDTLTYNSGKVLRRTIESVLAQTYSDFTYYLRDNNSTDNTRDIIFEYARRDKRIIAVFCKENNVTAYVDAVIEHCGKFDDGYWAFLDHDDEYEPEFLEKMLVFTKEEDLDFSFCGSDFIDEETRQVLGSKHVKQDFFLSGTGFSEFFSNYHQLMLTIWGKLFTLALLRKCSFEHVRKLPAYGADSIFILEALKHAKSVGLMKGILHKQYWSTTNLSHKWVPSRVDTNILRDKTAREFLIGNSGVISTQNENYLQYIYKEWIVCDLSVLLGAQIDFIEKAHFLLDIFTKEKTLVMLREHNRDSRINEKIKNPVVNWLFKQRECCKADGARFAAEIIMTIYPELSKLTDTPALEQLIIEDVNSVKQILQEYSRLGL